jgi:hypothetical protein
MCSECGLRPIRARGVCGTCYERHRKAGTLDQLPTSGRGQENDYVVSEWLWLASFGVSRDLAALQLGMSRNALDKAIDRHQRKERAA